MLKARAAIFDTDGTLIEIEERFYRVFSSLLRDRGQEPISRDEFHSLFSEDRLDEAVEISDENREEELNDFWLRFLKKYRKMPPSEDSLLEGADDVLRKISEAGSGVAITTNCIVSVQEFERELESHGLLKYAETVSTGKSAVEELSQKHHFSKLEIIKSALDELGAIPSESVVIGDYWNDIQAGNELGAGTVAVMTGSVNRELLEKVNPDAILGSVQDLLSVVNFAPMMED